MDLLKLAQQHIETALAEGFIKLEDGSKRTVASSQILALARALLRDSLTSEKKSEPEEAAPMEMFSPVPDLWVQGLTATEPPYQYQAKLSDYEAKAVLSSSSIIYPKDVK